MSQKTYFDNRTVPFTASSVPHDTVAPPVDIYENGDEILIAADVPGASPDDIDVQIEEGQLTIRAKRAGDPVGAALATEYRPRDFFRAFSVPQDIDGAKIDAQLTAGVLRLRLPKSASLKARRIEVQQG